MDLFGCLYAPGNLPLLVECARQFSPHIEEAPPDAVIFDLTGLEKLFGEPSAVAAQIAARVGVPSALALAANPDCAWHAARGIPGITVIARGKEAAALATLPINLLQAPPEIAETLDQWGIRKFGELAALPPLGVSARLGNEGIRLWQLARGEWERLLHSARDPLHFAEELELEHPVDLLEPLAFLLSRMLHAICERLNQASLAAIEIRLRLTLENDAVHARTLRFPTPMAAPLALLKLLQLDLQSQPPAAPVVKVGLEAEPVRPRVQQHGLFQPVSPEPEKTELTIARIAAFVGAGNAGTPQLEDSHRPDAFRMIPFGTARREPDEGVRCGPGGTPHQALRRIRPARLAEVQLSGGHPARVRSASFNGVVTNYSGPWHTSGDWWTAEPWDRDEWDVALSTGALLRMHFDHRTGRWFVEGSYD
jgi:protein ImuB